MGFFRRSRVRSSRGHVRVDKGLSWEQWLVAGAGIVALLLVIVIVITQAVLPLFEDEEITFANRTWLEFAWTNTPPNAETVRQLADRLKEYEIDRVYLEAAAWRSDGTLFEGGHAADFVRTMREYYPDLAILVWVRMSGEEIAQPERQAAVVELAQKAVRQWDFDGVQLNGRTVYNDSEAYILMLRALREAVGGDALLSATVPPDRLPADPDVPMGTPGDPDLTWTLNYKQRIGLLDLDELVVMAHASGLTSVEDYQAWVAYQVENYAITMQELEAPPEIVIALPTYEAAPEHDPAVESVKTALAGVKAGIEGAGDHKSLLRGVGLYEYKTTDSLEWSHYADQWLGWKPD